MTKPKHPSVPVPDDYCTTTDVALLLSVDYQVARGYVLKGQCGPVKMFGRHRCVPRATVVALQKQLQSLRTALTRPTSGAAPKGGKGGTGEAR